MAQLMPVLASVGRASDSWTPLAAPLPPTVTWIVKPTALPAATLLLSAILVTLMFGPTWTHTPARAVPATAFWLVTWTSLLRLVATLTQFTWQAARFWPPAGAVVELVTWTVRDAPGARS